MKINDYYKIIKKVDEIIENNEIYNEEIYELLTINEIQEYFFKHVSSIDWFLVLHDKGFFSLSNVPGLTKNAFGGSYVIPFWNVLYYLEKVSDYACKFEDSNLIFKLLDIIQEITKIGPRDNFRIFWYFVKIVSNLPVKYINENVIDLIPIWLGSKFDSTLPGREICDSLLPKFLDSDNDSDIKKANAIIEYITEIKPFIGDANDKTSLTRTENYKPILDEYWLLEVFEKYSKIIAIKCTNIVVDNIAKKIAKLLKKGSHQNSFDYAGRSILFSLREIENGYDLTIYNFELVLSRDELIFIKNELGGGGPIKGASPKVVTLKNIVKIDDFINSALNELVVIFPDIENGKNDIRRFLFHLYLGLFNDGTYESFYDKESMRVHHTLSVFHKILLLILLERSNVKHEETVIILKSFLECKYLYFRKLALFIIGNNYKRYELIFWDYIKSDECNIYFENVYFGDEMGHILNCIEILDENHRVLLNGKILSLGNSKKNDYLDDEKLVMSIMQMYYQALSSDKYFCDKYNELKEITKIDPHLGPAISIGESRWGPGPSPLTEDDLLAKSNEELACILKEFKTKDPWKGPTEEGLASNIRSLAKQHPEKFIQNMEPFLTSSYRYIYEMFWGLVDAWNNRKQFDWSRLFNFIHQYIEKDEFWNKQLDSKGEFVHADFNWVVGVVGELIQVGTKVGDNAFSGELNWKAFEIVSRILDRLEIDDENEILDPVSHALNSPHGRILNALIYLALRDVRFNGKSGELIDKAVNLFATAFKKNVNESFTLFGEYLFNFNYLNEQWTDEILKNFYNARENINLWYPFMSGYLFSGKVHNSLYVKMNDHYQYSLDSEVDDKRFNEQLVQHIAVGYLRGVDQESSRPIFDIIITKWNTSHLLTLIQFFWMQRDYLLKNEENNEQNMQEFIAKILSFYEKIINHYNNDKIEKQLSEDEKKVISAASKLSVFLPNIDEKAYGWLMFSAPYTNASFDSPFFIEYLDNLKDKGDDAIQVALRVGDIFLQMLKSFIPDFDKVHIYSIIEYLYEFSIKNNIVEIKQKANDICNYYGPSGIVGDDGREFMRDLYEKYN